MEVAIVRQPVMYSEEILLIGILYLTNENFCKAFEALEIIA